MLLTHRAEPVRTEGAARPVAPASYRRRWGPGGGITGTRGRRRWPKRVLLGLIGFVVFGPIVAFAVGWFLVPAPVPDDLSTSQVATIEYANGQPLATVRAQGAQNRVKVPLEQVPQPVRYAVLAAEDRSFFSNPGFDLVGIARAAWSQLNGGAGGGSTITQQYIKNATGQDQHTLWRKFQEVIAAAKISKEYSKQQILADYLNTIYFGRGAYGIQAAAKAYFGVSCDQLDVAQGALLAGLIQSPSRWDPATNPTEALQRWNYVLDGMVSQHWLTPAERAAARFPSTVAPHALAGGIPSGHLGHIYSQVKSELADIGIGEQELNQEGLKITTTINQRLEQQAADISNKVMNQNPANLRAAMVAIDPHTGSIVADFGGDNGEGLDYTRVLKQPGSSFKPFVMAAALQQNPPIGLGTEFDGSSPQQIAGQTVANSDGDSCDQCDLKTAMTRSINTVYYQLAVKVGPDAVARAAHQAGIPNNLLPNPTAGIALGDKEVHPGDMASAYATFAANGIYHKPHLIARVQTSDGSVIYDNDAADTGEQRFTAQVARNVTESMLDVARGSLIPLAGDRQVAAKTGTTQSRVPGQNNDAWTVGYTPSLSTAVWVGTDDNSPIRTSGGLPIYGRMVAGTIWQKFMNSALRGTPDEQFSRFVPLGDPPDNSGDGSGDSDDSDSSDDSDGGDRHHHHHDGDSEHGGNDSCDVVQCDDNGNPVSDRHGDGDHGDGDDN